MKKFILTSVLVCLVIIAKAQIPFTEYSPVIIDPNTGDMIQQPRQSQNNFQTVNAYYINSRGSFQKIAIKVNVVTGYSGDQVYVRAYRDVTFGRWNSMNSAATPITQYSREPDVIKENFDWKCYILNIGNIYF